jgi:hypothetical protein
MTDRGGPDRRRAAWRPGLLLATIAFVAACSAVSSPSGLPSSLPTSVPSGVPGLGTNSAGTACLDASTMTIITALQAPGANIQSVLAQNKDALISGLQSFQPADATTKTWRDALVSALQSGDLAAAEAKVKEITTAGITLAKC